MEATVTVADGSVALPKTSLVTVSQAGCLQNTVRLKENQRKFELHKCIQLLRTPPQDGIGPGGKLTDEVDGIPGGLCHPTSTPNFEHFGWWLPKLATVMVTKGLVALPKAVWDVTVWRPVAYIKVSCYGFELTWVCATKNISPIMAKNTKNGQFVEGIVSPNLPQFRPTKAVFG
jgi:hypothetical protein